MTKPKRVVLWIAVSTGVQASEEKDSLPDQDHRLREIADQRGWEVVDVITVPGHSRVYYTYREFAEDAQAQGIPAPMRMFDHWQKHDFDIFACASGDRFGREQAIFAEVVSRTIDGGATVFTLRDGEINQQNKRMFVSMVGYSASVEVDELVRRRKTGMRARARRGLPTSSNPLIPTHTVVTDADKTQRVIVNPATRRLWLDVAELLLEGKSWREIAKEVAARGHQTASGKPYRPRLLARYLMHPTAWGNTAQQFENGKFSKARGFWVFDSSEPAPEHVTIYYNTHPALYEGELGERVKAELRRRFSVDGRAHPVPRHAFAGLVVCDECRYSAVFHTNGRYGKYLCVSWLNLEIMSGCTNRYNVSERKMIRFADAMLRHMLDSGDWSILYGGDQQALSAVQRLVTVQGEIDAARTRMQAIVAKQVSAPIHLMDTYDQPIRAIGDMIEQLIAERERLARSAQNAAPTPTQSVALDDLAALGLVAFWQLEHREINQWLHRIMGNYRFVIRGREVIGLSTHRRTKKGVKRKKTQPET